MDIMLMGEKNPNYLGSFDLYDLSVKELTLTIKDIRAEQVLTNGTKENLTVCSFVEKYKPMILNLTNKKRLAKLYGTKKSENLKGKRITIVIEQVKAFGKVHDALRIKEVIPASVELPVPKCESCGKDIQPYGSMSAHQMAAYTESKYGKKLCSECATAAKGESEQ